MGSKPGPEAVVRDIKRKTKDAIELVVELYDARGKLEKVNQWRAKLPEPEPETQQTEGDSE